MFHLFNKVYLTFEHNLSSFEKRIIFSKVNGVGDGISNDTEKKLKIFAKSVDEVVGEEKAFKNFLDLFKKIELLSGEDRLFIYCDNDNFLKLFIAWHKTILINPSSDSIWQNFMFYVQKESFLSSITQETTHVHFNYIKPSSWQRDIFNDVFEKIEINQEIDWKLSIISSLGIEFLISSYLLNKSNNLIKNVLKEKIRTLVNRVIQDELYDTKISIMNNTFNKFLYDKININSDKMCLDIFSNEKLKIYNDPLIWRENLKMTASNFNGALDIKSISTEKLEELISVTKEFRNKFQGCELTSIIVEKLDWIKWIVEDFTDEQLEEFLNNDELSSSEIIADGDKRQINFLFVDWILNQYKNNKLETFSDYNIL